MQLLGNQKPALKIKLNDRVLGSVVNRSVGCSEVPPHPTPGAQKGLLTVAHLQSGGWAGTA